MSYRYIGNKTRLAPQILKTIRDLVPRGAVVADLMCGTGSIAEALRAENYRVIASDLMTYALHHARIRLLLDKPPSFHKLALGSYADVLDYLRSLPPRNGLFVREYSPAGIPEAGCAPRMYFTSEN